MLNRAKKLIGAFPLIGGLTYCEWGDHWNAMKEFTTTILWAFMPIWLGAFVAYVMDMTSDPSYLSKLHDALKNGELYIYASSLLAPVFYMALDENKNMRSFYGKLAHMIFVGFIIVISAVLFLMKRLNVIYNEPVVVKVSYSLMCVSAAIYYIAIVYNNNRRNPSSQMRHDEDEYVAEYSDHRR